MPNELDDMITALIGPTANQRVAAGHAPFDPFTAAAYRQQQAVSPTLGRQEGPASAYIDNFASNILRPKVNALSLVNALARATTGDLLFPLERTTNQKEARAAQQRQLVKKQ